MCSRVPSSRRASQPSAMSSSIGWRFRNSSRRIARPRIWRGPCCRSSPTRRSVASRSGISNWSRRSLGWAAKSQACARPGLFSHSYAAELPLRDRHVVALCGARVELTRTADLLVRVLDHLFPLRDPADSARERKEHREHAGREAERLQRDTRIEIDIRIELLLDEIFVVQRNPFEFECRLQERIVVHAELVEHGVTLHLHGRRARIVVLVDAMAEAHQAEGIVLVLRAFDVFGNAIDR